MSKPLLLALALVLAGGQALAQGGVRLGRPASPTLGTGAGLNLASPVTNSAPLPADHVVALVNSEPVTNNEVRARLARLQATPDAPLPARDQAMNQVLERLIQERTQLQVAAEQGLKIDEATVARVEEDIARQNGLSVPALHGRLQASGQTPESFRAQLRNDLLLQRVREREVDGKVRVTERDIDAYLQERQSLQDLSQLELHLAQVLVQVREDATPATVEALRQRAEQIARRARAGDTFSTLARDFSDAVDRANGGLLGRRTADRYPALFVEATRRLAVGEVAGPVRSGAGFHVLKVVEKRQAGMPETQVTQTLARHILLRPGPQLGQETAVARLAEMRRQIQSGQARFEDLARQVSQDGSASAGGNLGWAGPGQYVPEFEQAMNALAPQELSQPLVSRFGVHLIQVLERRQVEVTEREQREWVRNLLREKKAEEAYETWSSDLRARAYVELREPPQ
jgi:peptidyl-prolyl cis-trans isomerase SurA